MIRWILFFLLVLGLTGCAPKGVLHPYGDVAPIAQSAQALPHDTIFTAKEQAQLAQDFDALRFAPWQESYDFDVDRLLWPWGVYKSGYGANKRPYDPSWHKQLKAQAWLEGYPAFDERAITLRRVNLRNFPTQEPLFRSFALAGEGFPFDYLQNSTLHAMTPVRITHQSAFGDWMFIESDHAHGWVRPNEVASLQKAQIDQLMGAQVVAITQEGAIIYGLDGRFLFEADIGTLLFAAKEDASGWRLLSVVSNELGEGVLEPAWMVGEAMRWPVSAQKLPALIEAVLGQSYGWGGLYGKRDCSALMRDLFTPLGRWLPRNSASQAGAGEQKVLRGLSSEEKLIQIHTHARAFATLINFPGHVGLYLGTHENEPIILHSTWGHPTQRGVHEGRDIIGQSVITTLKAGRGLHPDRPQGLIDRATGLTHLNQGVQHGE